MMLNAEKCVFGVAAGKLLGFLVSHRGIEANPKKIQAIERMQLHINILDQINCTAVADVIQRYKQTIE